MSTDFSQLIADIEHEARAEGPRAVRELERFREEFSLASQLIEIRRQGNLSQRDLAKLSGVPQSEISRIETGAGNPTYATITALLRPLGKRIQVVDDRPVAAGAPGRSGTRGAKSTRRAARSARSVGGKSKPGTSARTKPARKSA
jgi:transcriptional regulator with XRE-family HTH domain